GRTEVEMRKIEEAAKKIPGVKHTVSISGQSVLLGANAPNFGSMYVMLEDFHKRTREGLTGDHLAGLLQDELARATGAGIVNVFGAPPVGGLGTAGGFKIIIEDRGDSGLAALEDVSHAAANRGRQDGGLVGLFTSFRANTP